MEVKHIHLQKIGEFTFEFVDRAGNKGTAKAEVDWIREDIIFKSNKYKIEQQYISKISHKTTVSEFKKNIETNQELIFIDKYGKQLKEDDLIGTGTKLKAGDSLDYTLIVTGDIDGDAIITVNDLARLRLNCIEIKKLEGIEIKAADADYDGEITINDIAIVKLILIGLR